MIIAAIILCAAISVLSGRLIFGRWFNHITIYSITWGGSLVIFHWGLIRYYPLESETWMLIISAWLSFLVGSFTIVAVKIAGRGDNRGIIDASVKRFIPIDESELQHLHRTLWIINLVLLVHAAYEVYNVVRLLGGSAANFITLAGRLYELRVREGLPGSIPYLGQFIFFPAILSGIYTSAIGKLKFVAFLPFLIAIATSFTQVVRALALIVAILFICSYFLNRKRVHGATVRSFSSYAKRIGAVVFLVALLILTVEAIRSTRGMYERFSGQSSTIKKLRQSESSFITPSVIMYLSVHSGVLNQYLKEDVEHVVWGRYTFAPFWRIISKLGFDDTYVGFYQSWFYFTPVSANTGTYIRELHADFGVGGVVIVPYLLGLICSFYWYRVIERNRISDITILALFYAVVAMSWFVMIVQIGGWLISLVVGTVIAKRIDKKNYVITTSVVQ